MRETGIHLSSTEEIREWLNQNYDRIANIAHWQDGASTLASKTLVNSEDNPLPSHSGTRRMGTGGRLLAGSLVAGGAVATAASSGAALPLFVAGGVLGAISSGVVGHTRAEGNNGNYLILSDIQAESLNLSKKLSRENAETYFTHSIGKMRDAGLAKSVLVRWVGENGGTVGYSIASSSGSISRMVDATNNFSVASAEIIPFAALPLASLVAVNTMVRNRGDAHILRDLSFEKIHNDFKDQSSWMQAADIIKSAFEDKNFPTVQKSHFVEMNKGLFKIGNDSCNPHKTSYNPVKSPSEGHSSVDKLIFMKLKMFIAEHFLDEIENEFLVQFAQQTLKKYQKIPRGLNLGHHNDRLLMMKEDGQQVEISPASFMLNFKQDCQNFLLEKTVKREEYNLELEFKDRINKLVEEPCGQKLPATERLDNIEFKIVKDALVILAYKIKKENPEWNNDTVIECLKLQIKSMNKQHGYPTSEKLSPKVIAKEYLGYFEDHHHHKHDESTEDHNHNCAHHHGPLHPHRTTPLQRKLEETPNLWQRIRHPINSFDRGAMQYVHLLSMLPPSAFEMVIDNIYNNGKILMEMKQELDKQSNQLKSLPYSRAESVKEIKERLNEMIDKNLKKSDLGMMQYEYIHNSLMIKLFTLPDLDMALATVEKLSDKLQGEKLSPTLIESKKTLQSHYRCDHARCSHTAKAPIPTMDQYLQGIFVELLPPPPTPKETYARSGRMQKRQEQSNTTQAIESEHNDQSNTPQAIESEHNDQSNTPQVSGSEHNDQGSCNDDSRYFSEQLNNHFGENFTVNTEGNQIFTVSDKRSFWSRCCAPDNMGNKLTLLQGITINNQEMSGRSAKITISNKDLFNQSLKQKHNNTYDRDWSIC